MHYFFTVLLVAVLGGRLVRADRDDDFLVSKFLSCENRD